VGEEIRNLGDIGEVASKMLKDSEKKFKKLLEYQKEPSVNDIYHGFRKIASASGKGSQKVKTETLASMLLDADDMGR
jgi:DNA ligase-1